MRPGIIALILLGGLTTACVPVQLTYFAPSAITGDVYTPRSSCVPEAITFTSSEQPHPGLVMQMASLGDRSAALKITITGSAPMAVRAISDVTEIDWAGGGKQIAKLDFLTPDDRPVPSGRIQSIAIPDYAGDWMEVNMPSMTVDGYPLKIPSVRFTRIARLEICPMNG